MSPRRRLVEALAARLPWHYGWVILACVCAAGFSRQGSAVATLSIFVDPMTREFGWSRTEISAAVSVGGVLGALVAPALGSFLDRNGARAVLLLAVLLTGIPVLLLSFTQALAYFFVLYCIGRMSFAAPYDLGIYGSIVNWFVRRRAFATSIATLAQMSGLVAMPLLAHFVMQAADWRAAWVAVGATVLVVGFLPTFLLHVRRPEDLGQHPEGETPPAKGAATAAAAPEPAYTRREALATPAFWLLALFTLCIYPVQAGISLHQAPLLIERGLDPAVAAAAVSTFALLSAIAGFSYGFWPRRVPMRFALALVGFTLAASCVLMGGVRSAPAAYGAAALFGAGVGGLLTLLPIAWADYFGRASYGAIRGAALTVQVVAQASGPVLSGVLRDWTGNYGASVATFAGLALAGGVVALLAAPPGRPRR
ncbi:MAG: MFS transporter [Betaproteobacteria bacterium]|nr:MFS transporter [Betaproteobacteria bacterium]MDH5220415.1 MFS transporter [Betaproteobacteria bacterium]MDH5351472.1 MFS transporter [Betaproteobacteria bacterium]